MPIPSKEIEIVLAKYFEIKIVDPVEIFKVSRLDKDQFYYLVYFIDRDLKINHIVIMDGITLSVNQKAETIFSPANTGSPNITKPQGFENAEITLVWKPCAISRSPFYPFWKVEKRDEVFYVDKDNRIHTSPDFILRG
jgi:hypothetical protein